MEQSRRQALLRAALITAVALAVVGAVAAAMARRPRGEQVQGHAFAIPSAEDRIVIEVFNATGRQGLARAATRVLRRQGLDVVFLGNSDRKTDSSAVVVRRGDAERARRVAEVLGIGRVLSEPDTLRRVDVSVFLGPDYMPPAELHP